MIARLSSPLEELRDHYTVVVVGSGYGGAIAASRMARAGQAVCLLERGQEIVPGEYPDSRTEALREFRVDAPPGLVGSRTALFDLRGSPDMNVLVGCELGGTSLINANVALKAEPRVFDDPRWPQALRDDIETRLADGYARAEEMLRPTPYPAVSGEGAAPCTADRSFIHGAANQVFLSESRERTFEPPRHRNGSDLYSRHLVPGYGHLDAHRPDGCDRRVSIDCRSPRANVESWSGTPGRANKRSEKEART